MRNQFAVLYDTWQQGDGYKGAIGSGNVCDNGGGNGVDGTSARSMMVATGESLLEREVEEEDRGESLMFSYAVLTTSAAPRLAWLHERYPEHRVDPVAVAG